MSFFFQLLGTKGRTEVSEANVFFFVLFLVVAGVSAEYAVGMFTPEECTIVKRDLICRREKNSAQYAVKRFTPEVRASVERDLYIGKRDLLLMAYLSPPRHGCAAVLQQRLRGSWVSAGETWEGSAGDAARL
jgi:hypothetical protein